MTKWDVMKKRLERRINELDSRIHLDEVKNPDMLKSDEKPTKFIIQSESDYDTEDINTNKLQKIIRRKIPEDNIEIIEDINTNSIIYKIK